MPSLSDPIKLFVTGTDTDVGKSVVSYLLLNVMQKTGLAPRYLKPLQTGCVGPDDPEADAAFIAGRFESVIPEESTLYCLPQPKAPWLAALDAGQTIETGQLLQKLTTLKKGSRSLVIEGAGGVMVPITEDFLMLDLMAGLEIPVIIVARDGLGTINHTLLSIEALKRRGIPIRGVVFTAQSKEPTPPEMVAENQMAVEHFSGVPVVGSIEWIEDFGRIPTRVEKTVKKLLNLPLF